MPQDDPGLSRGMIVDHRNVGAAFRRLSLPIAISMLGDQLLGIVDTIAIGTLGPVALAGVTGASTIFMVTIFAMLGMWNGTFIVAAQRIGARDVSGFARSVRAGLAPTLLIAALALLASIPLARPMLHWMLGSLASVPASAIYLILRCASLFAIAVTGTLITGLGAAGHPRLSIFVLVVINLVHVPLLLVLALGFLTHHSLGIVGAGISSLTSECVGAGFAILYVARRPIYRIFERLDVDWSLALRCAKLGLPETTFLTLIVLPDPLIVALLAPLGALTVSAFRALLIVSDLMFVVPSPLQSATQTVVGQQLGARDPTAAAWFFFRARRVALWTTALAGAIVAALAYPLAYVFTLNWTVASLAAGPLALHMITLPLKGWAQVSLAPIRASGDTRFSMFVGILCTALVLPLVWLGIERWHMGLYSVPFAWIIAWGARLLLTEVKVRGGEWKRREPISV